METPKKTGFWTQHVDPSSGRTYFFNMALRRSYWELPVEMQAHIKTPVLDALREWDPETAERKYGAANQQSSEDGAEIQRRREEALTKSRAEAETFAASTTVSLDERMALAAQKRKAADVLSSAAGSRLLSSNAESSNEYLKLVRQLQQHDEGGEGTGGKWLVR